MVSLKSTIVIIVAGLLGMGLEGYELYSVNNRLQTQVAALADDMHDSSVQSSARIDRVSEDVSIIVKKMDITNEDLQNARKVAENIKLQDSKAAQRLSSQLETNSKAVDQLREDANAQLAAVQQDASAKIGNVSGEVQTVKVDLDATKNNVTANYKEMADMRDSLGNLIARNSTELGELRKRGERTYYEFDIHNRKDPLRIADVQLQLKKADPKKQTYDVVIAADDNKIQKKDRAANELVTFMVGKDQVRYELVVNAVDKDRIQGYVSTPKDAALAAEHPVLRTPQQ